MSTRIRQLAETLDFVPPASEPGWQVVSDDFADKFAELVIKETMQVVANALPSNTYLDVATAVIEHYKD